MSIKRGKRESWRRGRERDEERRGRGEREREKSGGIFMTTLQPKWRDNSTNVSTNYDLYC
jgi:hypothetical protein